MKRIPVIVMYVLLGGGVLLLLFYVGSPTMFSPPSSKPENTAITSIPEPNRPSGKISITSEIPGLSAVLSDRAYLMTKLDELDFWSGEKKIYEMQKSIDDDVRSLNIVLTDKEQPINQINSMVDGVKKLTYATGIVYNSYNAEITLFLYASPEVKQTLSLENLAKSYSFLILQRLYGVKRDMANDSDSAFAKDYKVFIVLERK